MPIFVVLIDSMLVNPDTPDLHDPEVAADLDYAERESRQYLQFGQSENA